MTTTPTTEVAPEVQQVVDEFLDILDNGGCKGCGRLWLSHRITELVTTERERCAGIAERFNLDEPQDSTSLDIASAIRGGNNHR